MKKMSNKQEMQSSNDTNATLPKMDEKRANLMVAIRQAGGAANAGLKPVNMVEKPKIKGPKGRGDLMKDLSKCLSARGGLGRGRGKK